MYFSRCTQGENEYELNYRYGNKQLGGCVPVAFLFGRSHGRIERLKEGGMGIGHAAVTPAHPMLAPPLDGSGR